MGVALYAYLKSQNQKATHFLIGSRIHDNPDGKLLLFSITSCYYQLNRLTDDQFLLFFSLCSNCR